MILMGENFRDTNRGINQDIKKITSKIIIKTSEMIEKNFNLIDNNNPSNLINIISDHHLITWKLKKKSLKKKQLKKR